MELLSQSFWPSSLKTAKPSESMAPKKQVQAWWFSRFLGGWVLNPENGSDFGFKLWSSPVVHHSDMVPEGEAQPDNQPSPLSKSKMRKSQAEREPTPSAARGKLGTERYHSRDP